METAEKLITEHLDVWTSAVKAKSSAGRGSSKKQHLYGIKKLRKLILQLAVMGKLVPQDSDDEPASTLLKRISNERTKLIEDGKLKKQKQPTMPVAEEGGSPLPEGWARATFGDVVFNRDSERIPLSVDARKTRQGEFDYYGASGVIDSIDDYLFDKPLLLIGEDGANLINRSTPIAFIARGKYWVNNHAHVLDGISESLLFYVCLHINAISLEPYVTGTAQPKMNQAKMNSIVLAIPPAREQHRILAKVDELMALCDQLEQEQESSLDTHDTLVATLLGALTTSSAHGSAFAEAWQRIQANFDTLFTTESSIDQLKQTILQLAVMGKLVPQDSEDEPAGDTLVKIESRKEELRVSKGIRKTKPFPPVAGDEKRFPIPSNWKWVCPDHLCYQITDGAHHTPEYVDEGIPFLSVKDMSKRYLDFSSTRYVSPSQHEELIKRCNPEHGDLLLTKIGTTGIPVVINTEKEFSIFVSVALLKFPQELLYSNYFKTAFESPLVKEQSDEFTMGVGNKNLVLKHIRNFALPLPPLAEQHRIVAKVDELMALCDQLKASLATAQATQLNLADSLVEEAIG
ncbi:restriction endonuclease subunit S [Verrucomicrobia bacterium]|nr:restriction endonuclease subunit S [Verrucomicrobiota bacterium]